MKPATAAYSDLLRVIVIALIILFTVEFKFARFALRTISAITPNAIYGTQP